MSDLDTRLRALKQPALNQTPVLALRGRAARRRRHRRRLLQAGAAATTAIIVGAVTTWRDGPDNVATGPGPTPTIETPVDQRTLGDVEGVEVTVEPRTGLSDGHLVTVSISGLEALPDASVVQCAGDVTEATAQQSCDLVAVQGLDGEPGSGVVATAEQTVALARTIHITNGAPDPNVPRAYDCATEPAGCVLAVGPVALPARAVLVDLEFVDGPASTVDADVAPAAGLRDGQSVEITATGLRPNGAFTIRVCGRSPDLACDGYRSTTLRSIATGSLSGTIEVHAALYGEHGRADCVPNTCEIQVLDANGALARVPIEFDPAVVTAFATLTLDPPGPYADQQDITVRGHSFPPGIDLSSDIGQCPADKDTAVEERCGYGITPEKAVFVNDNGTFTMTFRVFRGTCATGAGCVVAWVISHGSIAARTEPLTFDN
jgi:hypothetical protein